MDNLKITKIYDDGLIFNPKYNLYVRPKTWNSFRDISDPGIIIIDSVNETVQINYPGSSIRQPCKKPYDFILRDIDKYLKENKEMMKFKGSDFIFPDGFGSVDPEADVYINPRLIMRLKRTSVKIRTTFASESLFKLTSINVYENILISLKNIFMEI